MPLRKATIFSKLPLQEHPIQLRGRIVKRYPYSQKGKASTQKPPRKYARNKIHAERLMSLLVLKQAVAKSQIEKTKAQTALLLGRLLAKEVRKRAYVATGFTATNVPFTKKEIALARQIGTENLEKIRSIIECDYTDFLLRDKIVNPDGLEEHLHVRGEAAAYDMLSRLLEQLKTKK